VTTSLAPTDESIAQLRTVAEKLLGAGAVTLESIDGGRNSRVYRLRAASGCYAFKTYFRHASDARARMDTEFGALRFLWDNGERRVPEPIVAGAQYDCAIYEWIEGERAGAGEISECDIHAATDFLIRLREWKDRPGTEHLRPASEACFSARALVECLRGRLEPLLARTDHAELSDYLRRDLTPVLNEICAAAEMQLGGAFDRDLPDQFRTLSPSDFGFHNALRRNGELVFLDFEYFGWDDPVKMICDFLLHPGMTASPELKRLYAATLGREFPEAAGRVPVFFPLFGLKWCLILLNEFLPAQLLRRKFAGMNERDIEARQSEQLSKARSMLRVVLAGASHFPYGD
jgi:phosphotransferase family enzyme